MPKDLIFDNADMFNQFELVPRIEVGWFDVLDYIRPHVDSFSLYCQQKYKTEAEYKALLNNYPFDLLLNSLLDIDISSGWLRFAINDDSIRWLKEQQSAFIYVPGYFHPFNSVVMTNLRFHKNAADKYCEYEYSFEDDFWEGLYSDDVVNNDLNDYLKSHHYFLDFTEEFKKDMIQTDRTKLIKKYASGDYFNILFLQQHLYTACKVIRSFYTSEIVELCAEILIERYKLNKDINLLDSLFLWLSVPIAIKPIGYDNSAGWNKVRNFLTSLDKKTGSDVVSRIIRNCLIGKMVFDEYDDDRYRSLVYNAAGIFKQINSPYDHIRDKNVLEVLKYFTAFDLKDNFYLDRDAYSLFKNELFNDTLLKY